MGQMEKERLQQISKHFDEMYPDTMQAIAAPNNTHSDSGEGREVRHS